MALRDPQIRTTIEEAGDSILLHLEARSLARFVDLSLEGVEAAEVIPSDNGFDLPAGRPCTITLPRPAGWGRNEVQTALRIRSLRDSYT